MSIIDHPFICDGPGCGRRRENDSNHWWIMWEFTYEIAPNVAPVVGLAILPWRLDEAMKPGRKHLCGVSCALKLSERALTMGTLDLVVADQQLKNAVKH